MKHPYCVTEFIKTWQTSLIPTFTISKHLYIFGSQEKENTHTFCLTLITCIKPFEQPLIKLDRVGPVNNRPPTDKLYNFIKQKSRIQETKHLSTNADSSTDTTVGWTKNTQKPNFFLKRKKLSKTQKLKNV